MLWALGKLCAFFPVSNPTVDPLFVMEQFSDLQISHKNDNWSISKQPRDGVL